MTAQLKANVQRFRKKPVLIEACLHAGVQLQHSSAVAAWCGGEVVISHHVGGEPRYGIIIATLEGDMIAYPGDWIIRGVAGEFYPCKPEIFRDTYEHVGASSLEPTLPDPGMPA